MPALSPFSEPLPLSTGDTLHVAEWSQIKEGVMGTGMGGGTVRVPGWLALWTGAIC